MTKQQLINWTLEHPLCVNLFGVVDYYQTSGVTKAAEQCADRVFTTLNITDENEMSETQITEAAVSDITATVKEML